MDFDMHHFCQPRIILKTTRIMKLSILSLIFMFWHVAVSAGPVAIRANPTGPLEEFHTKFFFGIFISDDDALFSKTFDSGYSRDLVEKYEHSTILFSQHPNSW